MAAANARVAPLAALSDEITYVSLFKEDHPRRIDRVIGFFGEEPQQPATWDASEPWSA